MIQNPYKHILHSIYAFRDKRIHIASLHVGFGKSHPPVEYFGQK